ncbi:hypothetical protein FRC03_003192 [Tulasnella sp. 419]|nr:hypothetical protein FRC03_003192 [Tulasnella sp. 419]
MTPLLESLASASPAVTEIVLHSVTATMPLQLLSCLVRFRSLKSLEISELFSDATTIDIGAFASWLKTLQPMVSFEWSFPSFLKMQPPMTIGHLLEVARHSSELLKLCLYLDINQLWIQLENLGDEYHDILVEQHETFPVLQQLQLHLFNVAFSELPLLTQLLVTLTPGFTQLSVHIQVIQEPERRYRPRLQESGFMEKRLSEMVVASRLGNLKQLPL